MLLKHAQFVGAPGGCGPVRACPAPRAAPAAAAPSASPLLPQRLLHTSSSRHPASSRPTPFICRAEITPQSGETSATPAESNAKAAERAASSTSTQSQAEEAQSRQEAQTIGELKRQQLQSQSQTNVFQGALEEAQLITWPSLKKAFSDTVLVIAIVAATGSLLFGVNVVLAEASQWWYHR